MGQAPHWLTATPAWVLVPGALAVMGAACTFVVWAGLAAVFMPQLAGRLRRRPPYVPASQQNVPFAADGERKPQ